MGSPVIIILLNVACQFNPVSRSYPVVSGCHRQQMVVVLVGVQGSMDSPINSQIGSFSTILHDVYSMFYYKGLEVRMLGDSNIL